MCAVCLCVTFAQILSPREWIHKSTNQPTCIYFNNPPLQPKNKTQTQKVEGELASIRAAIEAEKELDEGAWLDLLATKECMWYRVRLAWCVWL